MMDVDRLERAIETCDACAEQVLRDLSEPYDDDIRAETIANVRQIRRELANMKELIG